MKRERHYRRLMYPGLWLVLVIALGLLSGCGSDEETTTPKPAATDVPTQAAENEEVLIVTGEFPPFTSESMEGGGLAVEIVNAVFAEMGRPLRVGFYPWARCEEMVQNGEAWGAIPYVPTEERRAKYDVTDNLFYGREMWFYYGDQMKDVQHQELADLEPYRIGVALGYWYIESFTEAGLTMDEGPDELAGLRKLREGRIDLFPVNELVAAAMIQENFPDDIAQFGMLETPLQVNDNVAIVARTYPNSQEILEDFNAAFARIQENGTYQEIMARYQLETTSVE